MKFFSDLFLLLILCVCACECCRLWRLEEVAGSPGVGVMIGDKLSDARLGILSALKEQYGFFFGGEV